MRFGIALARHGPLAEPAAVAAAARAAEELCYASVWSGSSRQLGVATAATRTIPVGLLLDGSDRPRLDEVAELPAAPMYSRLAFIAVAQPHVRAMCDVVPARLVLSATSTPPDHPLVRGWAPLAHGPVDLPARWRADNPCRVLVLRIRRPPTEPDLQCAVTAGVDELVVSLPAAASLDHLLGGFADIAERLAAQGQSISVPAETG